MQAKTEDGEAVIGLLETSHRDAIAHDPDYFGEPLLGWQQPAAHRLRRNLRPGLWMDGLSQAKLHRGSAVHDRQDELSRD